MFAGTSECHASIRVGRERGCPSNEGPATEMNCSRLVTLEKTKSGDLSRGGGERERDRERDTGNSVQLLILYVHIILVPTA